MKYAFILDRLALGDQVQVSEIHPNPQERRERVDRLERDLQRLGFRLRLWMDPDCDCVTYVAVNREPDEGRKTMQLPLFDGRAPESAEIKLSGTVQTEEPINIGTTIYLVVEATCGKVVHDERKGQAVVRSQVLGIADAQVVSEEDARRLMGYEKPRAVAEA